jgi:hypothetical protein
MALVSAICFFFLDISVKRNVHTADQKVTYIRMVDIGVSVRIFQRRI